MPVTTPVGDTIADRPLTRAVPVTARGDVSGHTCGAEDDGDGDAAIALLLGAVLSGCAAVVMLAGAAASALVLHRVATALLVCAGVCAGLAAALTAAWRRTPRSSDAPRR